MAEPNGGLPVLTLVLDHEYLYETDEERNKYHLNERELERILMSENIKNLPVAVVSVAGAYRGGKSFLLNFFLRYLSSTPSAREDGTWLGDDNAELTGFSWREGSERDTTGILLWTKPFIIQIPYGEKVAVLLIDTQGTFDGQSSYRDCSTVFALSTLLSTIQIYNLKTNIGENDLQNLQLFTKYGKFMKDRTGKAFQELRFLIRDWTNHSEYGYGINGGDMYVANKLKIFPKQQKELKVLREQIMSSFETISGFLMPHPGLEIGEESFKGRPKEIHPRFKTILHELVTSIFSPNNLKIKLIGGHSVKCSDLLNLFRTYVAVFNSNELPEPKTILTITAEAGLLMAENKAREQFIENMKRECELSMPEDYVKEVHRQQLDTAQASFMSVIVFADKEDIDKKLEQLLQELNLQLEDFQKSNRDKTNTAMKNGMAAYNAKIKELANHGQLCVHVQDLENVHEEALAEATNAFNEKRKILPADTNDPDRQKFLQEIQTTYDNLQRTNEFNNMASVHEVINQYLQFMLVQCNHEPQLTNAQFDTVHTDSLARAFVEFELRRNKPNHYTEDLYKTSLEENILREYNIYKRINASSNARLLQLGLMEYYHNSLSTSELRSHCLHPDELKEVHETAVLRAKSTFRPNRPSNEGFDVNDPDENTLKEVIDNHFETMSEINNDTNRRAKESAFEAYKEKFDALTNYFTYFSKSWKAAKEYHDTAFSKACGVFYGKRRSDKKHDPDSYISELEKECIHYYNPENRKIHKVVEFIGEVANEMEKGRLD